MISHRTKIILLVLVINATRAWGGTLTLQECLELARKNNPALKSSAWDTRIAENGIGLASATKYPRLDFKAGYTVQQAPQAVIISGMKAETQEPDYASGSLSAYYTIYDFGRREAKIQQVTALADSSRSRFDALKADTSMQVIEAYFGILEAERLITAAAEALKQVEQHKLVAQALFEEGVVTRNDLLQAEVKLAAARQNLLTIRNRRDNIWFQLNYLTGADQQFKGKLDEKSAMAAIGEVQQESAGDLVNRAELKAIRSSVEASEAAVKESRSNYYPELFTQLSLDYVQNRRVNEQAIMSAMIGIKFNLFEGFATTSARERAVLSQSRHLDVLRQTEAQIRLEIATANNDMQVAGERITETETAIRQGEENLRINNERYQERAGTATEVLDAQTLLTQTKSDYYHALFDYQVASARLKRAMGIL